MITVIEQTTQERKNEAQVLFEKIKPLLDQGYGFHSALQKIGRIKNNSNYYRQGWFKELKEYAELQGYNYRKYIGVGFKRV